MRFVGEVEFVEERFSVGVVEEEVDGASEEASAEAHSLRGYYHVLAEYATVERGIVFGGDEYDGVGVSEHCDHGGVLRHAWVGAFADGGDGVDVGFVVDHTYLPWLFVHAAWCVDAALDDSLDGVSSDSPGFVLADAAAVHDGLDDSFALVAFRLAGRLLLWACA